MNLVGNGIKSSLLTTNKYLMRKTLEQAGVPIPAYIRSDELSDEITPKLQMPLIVKPTDRSGSRGVNKINKKDELFKVISIAQSVSFENKAIIEEYIEGQEYSVEYISYEGQHTFLALTEKITTGEPHFVETGHKQPAKISNQLLQKLKEIVEHSLDALKIRNGASHAELKIDTEDNIRIIEIGGRMGGGCIGSDLVQLSTGYDYVNMVIDIACGNKPFFCKVSRPRYAEIHFIMNKNDLDRLENIKRKSPDRIYRISEINKIKNHEILDSTTRFGYYILQGSFLGEVRS